MSVKRREYVLTVNQFREPEVLEGKEAVAMLLLRLVLMMPGTDPLHPDMGVGIMQYRYGMDILDELKARTDQQVRTYLPYFTDSEITYEYFGDHMLRVKMTIGDEIYVYETAAEELPVTLDDINDETDTVW